MEPVTLRTARLLLRPFADEDADAVHRACQDPDIQFFTPVPKPYRLADAEEYVGVKAVKGWADGTHLILGAFRAEDGGLVGSFSLDRLFTGVYELGYWTVREQRRRGFAEEAARALCAWGFTELGANAPGVSRLPVAMTRLHVAMTRLPGASVDRQAPALTERPRG